MYFLFYIYLKKSRTSQADVKQMGRATYLNSERDSFQGKFLEDDS